MINAPYITRYSNLFFACLDQESHERTCGYWYTVTAGAVSCTAFRTLPEFFEWLTTYGLSLEVGPGWRSGEAEGGVIAGSFCRASHRDVDAFMAIEPILWIPVLDNGRWTLGKVTEENGERTVHFINVNDRRGVFPWGGDHHWDDHGTDRDTVRRYIETMSA